ncbi:unnamed protein product [Clonostachys rhizophaga]|uniref:F-box domain-containing protein n=1 Tax=Clonostachys rhizophaga TaxID=160324 RepID=A0A9N9YS19_9HYPO|nr:unnamed protein product [Clonostachys rhizophaga]
MVRIRHMRRVEVASWCRLPAEIQAMILGEIVAEADATLKVDQASVSAKPNQGIGRLASVCRDWQGFFERHTFKRLLLIESNLSGFEQVILSRPVRLTYIQNLLLRIKLSVYNCKACEQPEDASTIKLNNAIFSSCIQHLLNTLASWSPEPCNSSKPGFHGLTLEISVYSPSDNNHRFNFCAQENDYPFRTEADLGKTPSLLEYHRQRAALGPTAQQKEHESGTLFLYRDAKRLYGTPLKLGSTAPVLPRAPIVKGLLLRRSTCRSIDVGALAQILRQSLVALTWFRYESRRPVCYLELGDFAEGI